MSWPRRRSRSPTPQAEAAWRVQWQDWRGHTPSAPKPRMQHRDFADRTAAEEYRRHLRATFGPLCLAWIVASRKPLHPPTPTLTPTLDDPESDLALAQSPAKRTPS